MNVLVYRSQLSTVLGEPVDLDQKQGTHRGWLPNISPQPQATGAGKPRPYHLPRVDPTRVSQLVQWDLAASLMTI